MAIVIAGVVTLNRIPGRTNTTTLNDDLSVDRRLTFTGETAKRWHTAAQAKEVERQLHELAWHSRHAGGVHINSDEFDFDDGLYELSGVETSSEAVPFGGATIMRASLTLRRLGGDGAAGANLLRVASPLASLQTNSFSVTSTPMWGLPVGATGVTSAGPGVRIGADGTLTMRNTTSPETFAMSGADYNAGECKIWDTTGAAEGSWQRVWSPDHSFSNPGHIVIDNSLVRFKGKTSGNLGFFDVEVYNGGWVAPAGGAYTTIVANGVAATAAWSIIRIDTLTPWRAAVTLSGSVSSGATLVTLAITLDRGRYLAKFALSSTTSGRHYIGVEPGAWTLSENGAEDHALVAAETTIGNGSQPWIAAWSGTSATGALTLGATATTTPTFDKSSAGGWFFDVSAVTSISAYLGGVPYDLSMARSEAESGALIGTATTAARAGASGGGNNAVLIDANGEGAQTANLTALPPGDRVIAHVRVQNNGVNAGDTIRVDFFNVTTALAVTNVDVPYSALGSSGSWKWMTLQYSAWNGTDVLRVRCFKVAHATADAFYVDQFLHITTSSASLTVARPRLVGREALTETTVWVASQRQVG